MLTAAASNLGETCRRAGKSASRLAEKPVFVEVQHSPPQCSRNFSDYIAPQLSGRSGVRRSRQIELGPAQTHIGRAPKSEAPT
ncbi:hypothetical protein, partial [Mesorhizobium sp.]|uniref:hypothetical protein n=1 Tax=Mesorhizobium sp. TaxID=1871066 RepID=UPI0025BE89A4